MTCLATRQIPQALVFYLCIYLKAKVNHHHSSDGKKGACLGVLTEFNGIVSLAAAETASSALAPSARLERAGRYQSSPMAEATIQPPTSDVPNITQMVVHNFASSCIVLSRRPAFISHRQIRRLGNSQETHKNQKLWTRASTKWQHCDLRAPKASLHIRARHSLAGRALKRSTALNMNTFRRRSVHF
jgi:hypothetical protein